MKSKLKKAFLLGLACVCVSSANVNAASVAGSEFWDLLDDEEYLTKEEPFAIFGGVKYELNKRSAPDNYPMAYHENKHHGTAYVGFSWLFTENWKLNGYLSAERKWRQNHKTRNETTASAYVDGKIGVVKVKAGGVPVIDALNLSDGGLVIGGGVLGGQVEVPVGSWKIQATGGVLDVDSYDYTRIMKRNDSDYDEDSTYLSLQASGNIGKNISAAVGVHSIENDWRKGIFENNTEKRNTIWSAGVDYKIANNWTIGGIYAMGDAKVKNFDRELSNEKKSYSIQLTYGTPESSKAHNTSTWLAFRQLGQTGSLTPAYHGVGFGERGIEIGARHNLMKNLSLELVYFNGKKNNELVVNKDKPKVHNWYTGLEYTF